MTQKKKKQPDERVILTFEQAEPLLVPGESVHCFLNPQRGMMIGADWDRDDVLEVMRVAKRIEVTGPVAQEMKHGLAVWSDRPVPDCYFFETHSRTDGVA